MNRVRRRDAAEDETIPGPADHETLQSLFGKHNYWKLLTPLLTLTAQVTKGNNTAELHATGSQATWGIDERGRFLKNIPHPFH